MSLKTDYKNDMFSGKRKYRMIQNEDGTVSFDDVTQYVQDGDIFSADDINATNKAVNEIDTDNIDFQTHITERVKAVEKETDALTGGTSLRFTANGWSSTSPFTQTVIFPGLRESDRPTYGLLLAGTLSDVTVEAQRIAWGHIDRIASENGKATAYCYSKKPITDVTVVVKGVVDNG